MSIACPSASWAASSRCGDRLGVGVADGAEGERPPEVGDRLGVVATLVTFHLHHLAEQRVGEGVVALGHRLAGIGQQHPGVVAGRQPRDLLAVLPLAPRAGQDEADADRDGDHDRGDGDRPPPAPGCLRRQLRPAGRRSRGAPPRRARCSRRATWRSRRRRCRRRRARVRGRRASAAGTGAPPRVRRAGRDRPGSRRYSAWSPEAAMASATSSRSASVGSAVAAASRFQRRNTTVSPATPHTKPDRRQHPDQRVEARSTAAPTAPRRRTASR